MHVSFWSIREFPFASFDQDRCGVTSLVCNLRPVFERVKFDVRRTLEPFKDFEGDFDPSSTALTKRSQTLSNALKRSQTLSNALQRYMCLAHLKC